MSLKQQPLQSGGERIVKRRNFLSNPQTTSGIFEESYPKEKHYASRAAGVATVGVVSSEQLASVQIPPRCLSKSERHQEYLTLFLEEKLRRRQHQKRRRCN